MENGCFKDMADGMASNNMIMSYMATNEVNKHLHPTALTITFSHEKI